MRTGPAWLSGSEADDGSMLESAGMAESNQKRQDILDAAAQLFARSGFDRATIRDIARAAHVSTGTIYAQFSNKDELLDGAVAERLGSIVREIRSAAAGLSPSEGFAVCLKTLFSRLSEDPLLARLLTFEVGLSTRAAGKQTHQLATQIEAIGRFHLEDAAPFLRIEDREAAATLIRASLSGWLLAQQRGLGERGCLHRSRRQRERGRIHNRVVQVRGTRRRTLADPGAAGPRHVRNPRPPRTQSRWLTRRELMCHSTNG